MSDLHGTPAVVRLVVRRDRVRLLAWIVGIVVLVLVTAWSTKDIYPTQADLDDAAALAADNPASLAFNGPAQALDTIGGQIAWQLGAFGYTIVGLMTLLLLGRLTRGEEDSGRLELVRSMPVGRYAPLAAALAVVVATNAVVAVGTTVSLLVNGLPVHGSVVLGASYLAFGVTFVGITAVVAQISENPRVTAGVAGGVLGLAFAVRAIGDMEAEAVSWLSPIGWAQRSRPFAGERWWPLALCAAVGVAGIALAIVLVDRRDFGTGMVAPRPGPPRAAPSLRTPLALGLRLHRAAIAWWVLSVLVLGAIYGSLANAIDEFVSDNEALVDVIASYGTGSLTDAYLATALLVTALLASGPGLQIASRLRTEESARRAEASLAGPVSRPQWVASHFAYAIAGSGLAMLLGGLGLGVAYALVGGGAGEVPRLVAASAAYLPAVWSLPALAVAAFGLAPRWTAVAWVALGLYLVIAMFGPLLDLPAWVFDLSPFQHVPAVPADAFRALPVAALSVLVAALVLAGFAAFRRRDLVGM